MVDQSSSVPAEDPVSTLIPVSKPVEHCPMMLVEPTSLAPRDDSIEEVLNPNHRASRDTPGGDHAMAELL